MKTESQLRAENNDLMDPYWKPNLPPAKNHFAKAQRLINSCSPIIDALNKLENKDALEDMNTMIRVSISGPRWREFLEAYEALDQSPKGDQNG